MTDSPYRLGIDLGGMLGPLLGSDDEAPAAAEESDT